MSDLHLERLNSKPASVGSAVPRAALAVQPNGSDVSIEPIAVTPVGYTQKSNTDDHLQHALVHVLGQIKNEGALVIRNEERRKQIDAVLARMLESKLQLEGTEATSAIGKRIDSDDSVLIELEKSFRHFDVGDSELPEIHLFGSAQREPDPIERAHVLRKIEAALKRIGNLKTALSSSDEEAYARLLNINVSEAGLAAARVQLGESHFGTISASSTVDVLMSNLRAVVIAAHGRMTPELVRLVFP